MLIYNLELALSPASIQKRFGSSRIQKRYNNHCLTQPFGAARSDVGRCFVYLDNLGSTLCPVTKSLTLLAQSNDAVVLGTNIGGAATAVSNW